MRTSTDVYFESLLSALKIRDASQIAKILSPNGPVLRKAMAEQLTTGLDPNAITTAADKVYDPSWKEVALGCWNVAYSIHVAMDVTEAYREQNKVAHVFNRIAERTDRWILPILFTIVQDLRHIAMQADAHIKSRPDSTEKANKLEEAARTMNRSLTVCLNDRNGSLELSRKWGVYFIISVLFKVYFTLGTISLSTSLLRVLSASSNGGEMPSLEDYPKSHVVTFKYYVGILAFMEEDYSKAEINLTAALNDCNVKSKRNQELILMYLLPTHLLLHRRYPRREVLRKFPQLANLYEKLFLAAKRGDMRAFEASLASSEKVFIKKRIYLTMLKIRTKIVRPRLFEQIYRALDKKSRVSVSEFKRGLEFVGVDVDDDQVECWVAIMIYQGQMKGYISRERRMIVLSNVDAFPK